MRRLLLLLLLPLVCAWPSVNSGGGVPSGGGGGGFTDCATDGGSMLYCQDFEGTSGGNPSGETPAMNSDFNNVTGDYTTNPAPFDGAQSGRRGTSGSIRDDASFTAQTGDVWIQWIGSLDTGVGDFADFFLTSLSTTTQSPSLMNSNVDASTYNVLFFCQGFDALDTTTSPFNFDETYIFKIHYNASTEVGQLYVCPYDTATGNPFDSCTTLVADCDGDGSPDVAGPDGFRFSNIPQTMDDVFVSTTDLSP